MSVLLYTVAQFLAFGSPFIIPLSIHIPQRYPYHHLPTPKMCWRSIHLKSCWSPCFWYGDVASGSAAVAVYSIALSICLMVYTINVITGGDSSQLWLPFFETNRTTGAGSAQGWGGFTILFFIIFLFASILLLFGAKREVRGFMIPWMVLMWIVVLVQATFGLWLVFSYYIYLEVIFAAVSDWIWMTFNVYCYYVVRSHYRDVKYQQNPDIERLPM